MLSGEGFRRIYSCYLGRCETLGKGKHYSLTAGDQIGWSPTDSTPNNKFLVYWQYGGHYILSREDLDTQMIHFHPVINLNKIGDKLWTGHELPKPWSAQLFRSVQKSKGFLPVQKRKHRRIGVCQNFTHFCSKHFFVCRMIGFRVGTLLSPQKFLGQKIGAGIS